MEDLEKSHVWHLSVSHFHIPQNKLLGISQSTHPSQCIYSVYIYMYIYQTFSCHQIHEDTLFRLSLGGLCTVFRKHDMSQHVGHGGLVLLACFITNICTNGRNPAITTGLDAWKTVHMMGWTITLNWYRGSTINSSIFSSPLSPSLPTSHPSLP